MTRAMMSTRVHIHMLILGSFLLSQCTSSGASQAGSDPLVQPGSELDYRQGSPGIARLEWNCGNSLICRNKLFASAVTWLPSEHNSSYDILLLTSRAVIDEVTTKHDLTHLMITWSFNDNQESTVSHSLALDALEVAVGGQADFQPIKSYHSRPLVVGRPGDVNDRASESKRLIALSSIEAVQELAMMRLHYPNHQRLANKGVPAIHANTTLFSDTDYVVNYWHHAPKRRTLRDCLSSLEGNQVIALEQPLIIDPGDQFANYYFTLQKPPLTPLCGALATMGALEHTDRGSGIFHTSYLRTRRSTALVGVHIDTACADAGTLKTTALDETNITLVNALTKAHTTNRDSTCVCASVNVRFETNGHGDATDLSSPYGWVNYMSAQGFRPII